MIVFIGPAGSGKSTQGQVLAAKQGWLWISTSQLLRESNDAALNSMMEKGELVPYEKVNEVMGKALKKIDGNKNIILDGFTRRIEQAHWLVDNESVHGQSIDLVIVLDVPHDILIKRMELRGRVDDKPEAIEERLRLYKQEVDPILNFFISKGVKVVYIDGSGTIEQVHDIVLQKLKLCKLL